jgi:cysteine-rich repeat protein
VTVVPRHRYLVRYRALTIAAFFLLATSASAQITGLGTYPEPALPALPAAGGTLVDPTFGTTILRVTDAATVGGSCGTAYSYWPTFNADSTRLWAFCDEPNAEWLYDFDPVTLALSNQRPLFASSAPGGAGLRMEDAIWSKTDPDVMYVHDGKRLWSYDVVTELFTLVKDLSSLQPNLFLHQMSVSSDDDVFAFTKKHDTSFDVTGYLAYRRSTDTFPANQATAQIDEVQVDKSGRWLVVKTGVSGAGAIESRIVDLETGAVEGLTDNGPDFGPGHSDNGTGTVIGADNWNNQLTGRGLATPHVFSTVFGYGDDWTQDIHISMLADDERWVTLTSYRANSFAPAWGPLHGEVYQVATDGTQRVRRLAHHRSDVSTYYESPRGNVSRDGRFVAFTSNWGGSSRHDLFVVVAPATGMCGDGTVDVGETCDDGDLDDGDGCDSNCTPTGCGNGVVTTAEDCDDGNVAAGDCCSPACLYESTTTSCSDANPCTQNDACDGAGVCRGAPEPLPTCRTAAAGQLKLKTGRNPSFLWQWKKGDAALADFGDPVGGDTIHTLCIYDRTGSTSALRARMTVPPGGTCRGRPCWSAKGTTKLAYKDNDATPDGVSKGVFKAGTDGKASIQLKGKAPNLLLPSLPLAQQNAVVVQLRSSDAACWDTTLTVPATRNDSEQFKDKQ